MADRGKREDAGMTDAERDELIRGRATGEDDEFEESDDSDDSEDEDVEDEGGVL